MAPAGLFDLGAVGKAAEDADGAGGAAAGGDLVDQDLDLEAVAAAFGDGLEEIAAEGSQAGDRRQAQEERVPQAAVVDDAAGEHGFAGEDRGGQGFQVLGADSLDVGVEEDQDRGAGGGDSPGEGPGLVAGLSRRAGGEDGGAGFPGRLRGAVAGAVVDHVDGAGSGGRPGGAHHLGHGRLLVARRDDYIKSGHRSARGSREPARPRLRSPRSVGSLRSARRRTGSGS